MVRSAASGLSCAGSLLGRLDGCEVGELPALDLLNDRELHRITKPGGWIAFEVGEVRRGTIKLDEVVAPLGIAAGLECSAVLINAPRFTKTANIWGVKNNNLGTNSNRIVLFQKK
jgi:hypothetical protein